MTRMIRWNPTRDMMAIRNEFDRLFDEAFGGSQGDWESTRNWRLPLDVKEHDEEFVVEASIPGIDPDNIDISLADNTLTIKAAVESDENVEEGTYHLRERRYGTFLRSVTLPVQVNADGVEASYHNGVLTLNIPKAEEIKPRRIAVKVGGNGRTVLEG